MTKSTKRTKKDEAVPPLSASERKHVAFQALWTTYLHLRAWGLPEYEQLTLPRYLLWVG